MRALVSAFSLVALFSGSSSNARLLPGPEGFGGRNFVSVAVGGFSADGGMSTLGVTSASRTDPELLEIRFHTECSTVRFQAQSLGWSLNQIRVLKSTKIACPEKKRRQYSIVLKQLVDGNSLCVEPVPDGVRFGCSLGPIFRRNVPTVLELPIAGNWKSTEADTRLAIGYSGLMIIVEPHGTVVLQLFRLKAGSNRFVASPPILAAGRFGRLGSIFGLSRFIELTIAGQQLQLLVEGGSVETFIPSTSFT